MASSATQTTALSLGKYILAQVDDPPGADLLTRWMAHHIAEQIKKAERAIEKDKAAIEAACFETILLLWRHRNHLPDGLRPHQGFEPILRTIDRLNPDNPTPFFFARTNAGENRRRRETKVDQLMKFAANVDQLARIIISELIDMAVKRVRPNTEPPLETDDQEMPVIKRLLEGSHLSRKNLEGLAQSRLTAFDEFLATAKLFRGEWVARKNKRRKDILRLRQNLEQKIRSGSGASKKTGTKASASLSHRPRKFRPQII